MAIDAYVGLPGHGKSYGVVEHVIIPSLQEGRLVVTNIPLKKEHLLEDFGGDIEQLPLDWHETDNLSTLAPPGAVLVLDEVWRRWPAGQSVNAARHDDKQLLAEHRHRVDDQERSMRVVLVTQDLAQVSNWVRMLVESTFRISKKSKKFYVVSIYNGAVTGARPPKSALLRQTSGRFKKDVFKYYSSATQSKTGSVGDESTADGRASILKSIGLWASGGGALILGFLGIFGVISFFSSSPEVVPPKEKEVVEHVQSVATNNAIQAVYTDLKSSEPSISKLWRVGGYVQSADEDEKIERVALISGSRARFIPLSECVFYPSGIDVYCDVDGERITPWSGQGAVSTVFEQRPSVQQHQEIVYASQE